MYRLALTKPPLRVGLSMVLLLLGALLVFAAGACGGEEERESKGRPLPEERQTLSPGTYRSEEFEPSLSFRVGEGWTNDPPEASDELLITWGRSVGLGFVRFREIYEPTGTGTPSLVEAPDNLVGWHRRHPYLRTDEPEPVTVGGVEGVRFDAVVRDVPEGYHGVCGVDCVDMARLSSGSLLAFRKGDKQHLIVLEDVKGKTVIMGFGIQVTEFEEFAPEAQKVLDSVEWKGE